MQHLMMDLYHIEPARLADKALLLQVLTDYPAQIGMEAAGPPVLRDITTSSPLDDGMSGFVIIYTSHCSLHAWPPYGMVNLDVFSCEPFDVVCAIKFAKTMFDTDDAEINLVERATRSPRPRVLEASPTPGSREPHVSQRTA